MAKKFILFSKESSSMVSTWTDTIYCSILKNKSLTLRLNKYGEGRSGWLPSISNIKTPRDFINKFREIDWIDDLELEDILPSLKENHPIFAILIKRELSLENLEDDIEIEIQRKIDPIIQNAEISLPSGNTNKRIFIIKVRDYIKEIFLNTVNPPKGNHDIEGRDVYFK